MSRSLSASNSGAPSPACHVQTQRSRPSSGPTSQTAPSSQPSDAADRLERRRVDLDRRFGFREDLRDLVLDALQDLRVNDD